MSKSATSKKIFNFNNILLLLLSLTCFAAIQVLDNNALGNADSEIDYILKHSLLIDTHNDLPFKLYSLNRTDLDIEILPAEYQTDLQRLRKGGVGAQFWSAYIPCQTTSAGFVQFTLEQIDLIKQLSLRNGLVLAKSASDILLNFKNGKFSSLIGIGKTLV
jgi:Membrane dipeptidase (Peptidase family M19)